MSALRSDQQSEGEGMKDYQRNGLAMFLAVPITVVVVLAAFAAMVMGVALFIAFGSWCINFAFRLFGI